MVVKLRRKRNRDTSSEQLGVVGRAGKGKTRTSKQSRGNLKSKGLRTWQIALSLWALTLLKASSGDQVGYSNQEFAGQTSTRSKCHSSFGHTHQACEEDPDRDQIQLV